MENLEDLVHTILEEEDDLELDESLDEAVNRFLLEDDLELEDLVTRFLTEDEEDEEGEEEDEDIIQIGGRGDINPARVHLDFNGRSFDLRSHWIYHNERFGIDGIAYKFLSLLID